MNVVATGVDTDILLEFMYRLAQAQIACGEQTAKVELVLRRIASAYGARRSRVVVFPTAIFISLHEGSQERVTFAEGPVQSLRLDQVADVYELAEEAQRGKVNPALGLEKLGGILRKTSRFGSFGAAIGHTILSIGLAMMLAPSVINLYAAAVLGTVVGLLKALNRNRPVLDVPLPVVAATLVSALVFAGIEQGLLIDPLYVLIPPLVSFLPGAMLTMGMVELAYGDMVSGSSRLITGLIQLVLLVLGLAVGALLIGYQPENLIDVTQEIRPAAWITWLGVIVFAVGVYFHFSAPRRSFGWLLLVLLVAFTAQQLTSQTVVGNVGSGFFGMLVATPLGYLIQLRFHGPPAMVTFLPTFWLLVPGALSLLSIKQMLSNRIAGIEGLTTAIFVFTSIALGTLLGASLYKWLTERFNWWQLQIGRVGRYFRPAPKKKSEPAKKGS